MPTLAEKLVARACGQETVTPGELVICKIDLAMMHDSGGPRRIKPMLEKLQAKVWDLDKVVLITDHYVPENDDESRGILKTTRDWVREVGLKNFHDNEGICHVVLPENGYVRPGMFAVGGDSHSLTAGAFGAYMFGIGATEMLGALVTGEIWLRVPHTRRMEWSGRLAPAVSAKDIMLHLCGRFGMDGGGYEAVEYTAAAINALPMQERMTLANMTAEFGGQVGLIAPDATTRAWLANAGVAAIDIETWQSDADAPVEMHHRFDASALAPQVAAPDSPANAADVEGFTGTAVNVAYIGACTGAKLEDLRMAAEILKGRRVARGVKLLVAPSSRKDEDIAREEGTLGVLMDAGAELLPNACNACAGFGSYLMRDDSVAISSTARNFKGRMGSTSARIYLGSPYTVAASAVAGRIADPRELV
jgi:3-isopropylmalate/(R)-2-methylmalate dehydratase large subunit